MKPKKKNMELEVGKEFQAKIKPSRHSKTLMGEQRAGTMAFNGKMFTITAVRSNSVETENHDFLFNRFEICLVSENDIKPKSI